MSTLNELIAEQLFAEMESQTEASEGDWNGSRLITPDEPVPTGVDQLNIAA